MSPSATLARLGFDVPRVRFALRTALGACVALLAAWLLGLEHPQWAAMTVWIASLPTRGQLLEKSVFRLIGTVNGVVFGVVLLMLSHWHPAWLVLGLTIWIGLCAGIGNVQRGFVGYGTILAGYSAAMVALLGQGHSGDVFVVGLDRLLTIVAGLAVALVFGWFLTPKQAEDALDGRVRELSAGVLLIVAERLRGESHQDLQQVHALLAEMAAIEEMLDPHGAGSLRSRRAVRSIRALLIAELGALLEVQRASNAPADDALAAALVDAAMALKGAGSGEEISAALNAAALQAAGNPSVHALIADLSVVVDRAQDDAATEKGRPRRAPLVVLHRDWVGARQAAIRAFGAMLAVGLLWLATGWEAGAYMLLGLSVMMTLFSTFDNPAQTMHVVFRGQVLGVVGALACRWVAWPLATNAFEMVLLVMPFILIGAFVTSHRDTVRESVDYNLILLLLLQPMFPEPESFTQSVAAALAVLSAPVVAFVAYRLVYPVDVRRRRDTLIAMMVNEISTLAAAPNALAHRAVWRTRLYHRLLRLVRWTEKTGEHRVPAVDGGLAVLALGTAVFRLKELAEALETDAGPGLLRSVSAALQRTRSLPVHAARASLAFSRVAERLAVTSPADADVMCAAARALKDNRAFFQLAEG